jgi:hypothetical protein
MKIKIMIMMMVMMMMMIMTIASVEKCPGWGELVIHVWRILNAYSNSLIATTMIGILWATMW